MSYSNYESAQKNKDGIPLYGMDQEIQAKLDSKYDREKEAEVMDWIESVTGRTFPNKNDFHESLKDGTLLCELVNKISPGSIPKVNKGRLAFMQMENIGYFLEAAERIGLKKHDSFRTVDLYEAKNIPQVIQSLYVFGSVAQKVKGYNGPTIGVKLADKSEFNFSEDQVRQAKAAVGLQHGGSIKHDMGRSIGREVVKTADTGDRSATSMQSQASIKHDTGRSISNEIVKVKDTGDSSVSSQQSAASIKHDTGRSIGNHPVKIQTENKSTTSTSSPTSSSGGLDELEKLADLKNKGIITDDEFQQAKKRILGL
jgi:hypothetical protein